MPKNERYVLQQGYRPENESRKPERKAKPKRLFIIIAVCVLIIGVIVAGIIFFKQTPPIIPATAKQGWSATDMVGNWSSENVDGSTMKATIEQDMIAIYWHNDDTDALYWKGSFSVPGGAEQEKTVISDAGPENATALLASSDPQKTFTVRKDAITFQVSALGITKNVTLKKVK